MYYVQELDFYIVFILNLPPDIMKIKTLKGLALQDILTEVHLYVHRGQSINFTTEGKHSLFFFQNGT